MDSAKKTAIRVKLSPYVIEWMDRQPESRADLIETALNGWFHIPLYIPEKDTKKKFFRIRGTSRLHCSETGNTLLCGHSYEPEAQIEVLKEIAKAMLSKYFCTKCFPDGKPDDVEIDDSY